MPYLSHRQVGVLKEALAKSDHYKNDLFVGLDLDDVVQEVLVKMSLFRKLCYSFITKSNQQPCTLYEGIF